MVPPITEEDSMCDLDYLEYSDVVQAPGPFTHERPPGAEGTLHPLLWRTFPYWEEYCGDHRQGELWEDSLRLWNRPSSSFFVARIHRTLPENLIEGQPPWSMPYLHMKPLLRQQQRLDFLSRRQEYDEQQKAKRLLVTLVTIGHKTLKLSVSYATTAVDLVDIFCQARDIDWDITEVALYSYEEDMPEGCACGENELYIYDSLFRQGITSSSVTLKLYLLDDEGRLPSCDSMCELHRCGCGNMGGNVACRHLRVWKNTLWMDTEDWYLQGMFEDLEQ